jgi:hypothetical protein
MTEEKAAMVPPELDEGGRSTQRAARPEDSQALMPVSAEGGLLPLSFAESLQELSQIKGEAVMALLCTHANRLENDLRDLRAKEAEAAKASVAWMRCYHGEKERNAVLAADWRGESRIKSLQKFIGIIGGLVTGISIPFCVSGSMAWPLAASMGWALAGSAVGTLLLSAGLWPSGSSERPK